MSSDLKDLWESAGGKAPEHWKFVRFEDLLADSKSIAVGVMYPGEHNDSGTPLIKVSDVKNGKVVRKPDFCIDEKVNHEYRRTMLKGNELLITLVGNPGDCAIVDESMKGWNAARALAVVRLKDPSLRPWVRYVLLSSTAKHLINARLNTTVQKTLNLKDVKSLPIPIASSDEIASIVDIASTLESKINLNQEINQTLEQMAQAIFKSWFVDFEPVKAKIAALDAGGSDEDALIAAMQAISGKDADQLATMQADQPEQYTELRATAELFPSAMQESELGEIPEGWSIVQIRDIVERLKPPKRYTKKQVSPQGQVPVFEQGSDILLGYHDDEPGFIATATDPTFIFGDHTCITYLSCQKFDISQNVIPLKGSVRPTVWTYYAIQGKQIFQEYRRHWSELIVKQLVMPTSEICQRFTDNLTAGLLLKESLQKEVRHLSNQRDYLLPRLLSGEISVDAIQSDNIDSQPNAMEAI